MSTPERFWHMPDWERGIAVTHFWETKIQRTLSMKEERQSVADARRIELGYETKTMESLESQQLRSFIRGLNEQRVYHPFWPDGCIVQGIHLQGATTITVDDTTGRDWLRGHAVLWRGWVGSEVLTVTGTTDTTLTLQSGISNAIVDGEGLFIFPGIYGRIEKWDPESETDELDRWKIEFKEMAEAEQV